MDEVTIMLNGLRWGDLYKLVDLAREAEQAPHEPVPLSADREGNIVFVVPFSPKQW